MLLIMWSMGDEREARRCGVTASSYRVFWWPFPGDPNIDWALRVPWGCPAALPRCQGLTDSSNDACHRRARDRSRAGTELQSACVTSKEFWFLSSGEGVKRRPLWETGSTRPAFEYFSVYRMSVLGVGCAQKREVRGWLWWIFHKRKEKKKG